MLLGKIMTIVLAPMHIANGTSQGCPWSPLLYGLVMEYLAVALWSNPDIHDIRVGSEDNLLLYVTDPLISLPLIKEFERFRQLSNFKVKKTEALNITYDKDLVKHLTITFLFKWQHTS